jgi:hypothetical protein
MQKIKYIHCFGTSYTAGGGFEFDEKNKDKMSNLYQHTGEELNNFNFSYPGQLHKILGNEIKVLNHAKPGYGNHRLFRTVFDLVNNKDFKKDENLFLFEFSGTGRDEIYFNQIDDYIVVNYQMKDNNEFEFIGSAKDYHFQTKNEEKKIDSFDSFYKIFVSQFKGVKDELGKIEREIDFFIGWLENKNINYFFTSPPKFIKYKEEKYITYGDNNYFKSRNCMVEFCGSNKLLIIDETKKISGDLHIGLKGLQLLASIIFNKLISFNFVDNKKIEIDWKYFYELDYFKNKIL